MTQDTIKGVTSPGRDIEGVTPLDPGWQHVKDFILHDPPENKGMPRLERLQRIAGSLGKYADDVYFGELTMGDIGKVIGTKPALV